MVFDQLYVLKPQMSTTAHVISESLEHSFTQNILFHAILVSIVVFASLMSFFLFLLPI